MHLWKEMRKHRVLYLFTLPGMLWFLVFGWLPLYAMTLAFREFTFSGGMFGSPWIGFKYFRQVFDYYEFDMVLKNTIVISSLKLLVAFPAPIILALMLNEVRNGTFKRFIQTVTYLPYFVSWVVIVTLMYRLMSPYGGVVNDIVAAFGGEKQFFMGEPRYFYFLVLASYIFKIAGWNSIIFLASIAAIDPQLYESAKIDGAGRFRQMLHITLPGIIGVAIILFILEIGNLLFAGFEQIYLMKTPGTASLGTIIDTYAIEAGINKGRLSYATAIGFFQSAVGIVLVVAVNRISKKISGMSLW